VITRIGPNGEAGAPVRVSERSGFGYAVGVTAAGRIVTFGTLEGKPHVVALRPDGSPDPDFNGGAPLQVPGFVHMLLRPDGTVEVLAERTLTRVTPDGKIAHTVAFSASAQGPLSKMLPASSGGTLVYRGNWEPTRGPAKRLEIWHVAPDGRVDPAFRPDLQFGGGLGPGQNSFQVTDLLQRPDGSFLAVGSLSLVRYTGEGEGYSRGFFAAAAFTSALVADAQSFGGPPAAPTLQVRVIGVRRKHRFPFVRLRVTSNTPGMALWRVRDERGRVLAGSVEPVYSTGTSTIDVPATKLGLKRLGRTTRVRVGHDFADLFGVRATDVTRGRLR
jgi:hypothetical protein